MDNTFQAFPVIGHFVLFLNLIFWEIKFIYSEKATKFCEISTSLLSIVHRQGGDFAKFCGLLRIYELYAN